MWNCSCRPLARVLSRQAPTLRKPNKHKGKPVSPKVYSFPLDPHSTCKCHSWSRKTKSLPTKPSSSSYQALNGMKSTSRRSLAAGSAIEALVTLSGNTRMTLSSSLLYVPCWVLQAVYLTLYSRPSEEGQDHPSDWDLQAPYEPCQPAPCVPRVSVRGQGRLSGVGVHCTLRVSGRLGQHHAPRWTPWCTLSFRVHLARKAQGG